MSTVRLTLTPDLKKEIDFLRLMEYPTLTDAEIFKVAVGAQAVKSRKSFGNEPTIKEMMKNTATTWSLGEKGNEDQFWDESKLRPVKL
jgi:hypothetical protein